jgi:hypothetical protein
MTNGDEKQARTLLQHMAHPPNEGRVGAHAGANGPPGGNK